MSTGEKPSDAYLTVFDGYKVAITPSDFQTIKHFAAGSALISSFLDASHAALSEEAHALLAVADDALKDEFRPLLRGPAGRLATFAEIAATSNHQLVAPALFTVLQLSRYMLVTRDEQQELLASSKNPFGVVAASDFGLFPATALAASHTNLDLVRNGVEAVRLAFWVGLESAQYRTVPGFTSRYAFVAQLSDDMLAEVLALSTDQDEIYVAGIEANGASRIGGSAQVIRSARDLLWSRGVCTQFVVAASPYNNPIDASDISAILESRDICISPSGSLAVPLLSTASGQPLGPREDETLEEHLAKLVLSSVNRQDLVLQSVRQVLHKAFMCPSIHVTEIAGSADSSTLLPLASELDASVSLKVKNAVQVLHSSSHFADVRDRQAKYSTITGTLQSEIAVLGYSCRLPGADDPNELKELLQAGRNMCKKIPESLFNIADYHSNQYRIPNTMRASTGNFMEEPDRFDRHLFGFTEEEALQTDPQHRNALLAAYEALEMAGYESDKTKSWDPKHIGCFFGGAGDDYRENVSTAIRPHMLVGNYRTYLTANISRFFGFSGPSQTFDTACSSSLVAIEAACTNIALGKCKAAVAGGVSVLTQPQIFIGLDRGYFLSKTGQCKTFDDSGDGYSRGDAIGVVVLKTLRDALADGDPIQGVISAIGTNHCGLSHSITHPHAPTQARLFQANCKAAGYEPHSINIVEGHGTGTQAGDSAEINSIGKSFATNRDPASPVFIGSLKANLGHSEAASGSIAFIKCLITLRERTIFKHVGITTKLNTKFPPLHGISIAMENTPFPFDKDEPVRFCCNNFSAAGGNSNVMIREHKSREPKAIENGARQSPLTQEIIALSAKTAKSLRAAEKRLVDYIEKNPDASLRDIARTCSTRAKAYPFRSVYIAATKEELTEAIKEVAEDTPVAVTINSGPRVAVVFSGQGSQYINMGEDLVRSFPSVRAELERCDAIVRAQGFSGFLEKIHPTSPSVREPSPVDFQIAIFALEYSLARLWMSWGVYPERVVAGHSLGEYAALCISGVLTLEDALYLVATRATLMVERCTPGESGMIAIQISRADAEQLIHSDTRLPGVEIACDNSPIDTVLAGPKDQIATLYESAKCKGLRCMLLNVPYAFHSAAIQPIVAPFTAAASHVKFHPVVVPIASNVTGRVHPCGDRLANAAYLATHVRSTVRFTESMQSLYTTGPNVEAFLEIGPHPTTLPMIRSFLASPLAPEGASALLLTSLRKGTPCGKTLLAALKSLYLGGLDVDWGKFDRSLNCGGQIIKLPTYAFDYEKFFVRYTNRNLSHVIKSAAMAAPAKSKSSRVIKRDFLAGSIPTGQSLLPHCLVQPVRGGDGIAEYLTVLTDVLAIELSEGHKVHGKTIIPGSFLSEMALEAAHHVWDTIGYDTADTLFEIRDLAMTSHIIVPQTNILHIKAQGGIASGELSLTFSSWTIKGITEMGTCKVHALSLEETEAELSLINRLVTLGKQRVKRESRICLPSRFVYGLNPVIEHSAAYGGVREMRVHPDRLEAFARVSLPSQAPSRQFIVHPVLQDALSQTNEYLPHISRFDPDCIWIPTEWKSQRYHPKLGTNVGELEVFCTMTEVDDRTIIGDSYFQDSNGTIVGWVTGARMTRVSNLPSESLSRNHLPANASSREAMPARVATVADIPPIISSASSAPRARPAAAA
ncbi:hypothetical protein HDU89_006294 [Geranomyces variabilis]|nr:hypothetical protein HDU89_006294 [Geranomyces variabilis]